jgi:hypothetical protein
MATTTDTQSAAPRVADGHDPRPRRLVPSAYRLVLANRVFRRLLLGFAVSYLGDGMSFVAVAWLAIELAPQATAGLWVGGAVAAYTMPGVVGALVFGRRLRRVPARRLLLAGSSLLHAWGSAGKYTLLAELLPEEQRLAARHGARRTTHHGTGPLSDPRRLRTRHRGARRRRVHPAAGPAEEPGGGPGLRRSCVMSVHPRVIPRVASGRPGSWACWRRAAAR